MNHIIRPAGGWDRGGHLLIAPNSGMVSTHEMHLEHHSRSLPSTGRQIAGSEHRGHAVLSRHPCFGQIK